MAQARAVGVPTPEVLGVEHVEHDGELLSFSIQRLLSGRSLDELAGELPAVDLERLVMDGGELLARVHSVVPDRGANTSEPTGPPDPDWRRLLDGYAEPSRVRRLKDRQQRQRDRLDRRNQVRQQDRLGHHSRGRWQSRRR